MRDKMTSIAEAMATVQSGDTVCTSGFVGIGVPDALLTGLEERFLKTGEPRDLTLVFAAGQGDGKHRGLNALGHEGLLKRAIGGHWGLVPKVARLAIEDKIEAYNLPQGIISHLYRDIAAGKPGTISHVGLGTFVDPRLEGGKINASTSEDLVRVLQIEGIPLEAQLEGTILYLRNRDEPGVIGEIGTTLGKLGVNIATFALGRDLQGGSAITLVAIDGVAPNGVLAKVTRIPGVKQAKALRF